MESVWLIITTFRPTVLAVVAFLLLFVVGSLVLWIALELLRRWRSIRHIRRERRIYDRGLKELRGRQKRKAERDLFFDNVQRIMNDFNR